MTTFILHGGNTGSPSPKNFELYQELANKTPNGGKILFIFFAQEESKWKQFLNYNKSNFKRTKIKKNFKFEIATPEKSRLTKQLDSADCIYIGGGTYNLLKNQLIKIKNLKGLLEGKTIMGCSAGANILSTYFYRNSKQRIEEGLGILPIKVFCHYDENKKEKLEQLKNYKKNLPVHTIKEENFIILEKP